MEQMKFLGYQIPDGGKKMPSQIRLILLMVLRNPEFKILESKSNIYFCTVARGRGGRDKLCE